MRTQAQTWKAFLDKADTQELWDKLLDAAMEEAFAAGPSSRADYWLLFPDESNCHVFEFTNARRNEQ